MKSRDERPSRPELSDRQDHRDAADERKIREAALDETIEGTFPASDPLSTIPNPENDDALKKD